LSHGAPEIKGLDDAIQQCDCDCYADALFLQVAEMLRAHGGNKYFSRGAEPPKMHKFDRRGLPERDMDKRAGIGIALERHGTTGAVSVKRIASDGGAAADGRLRVADIILAVDGIPTAGVGQELTNLIIGPEGTYVHAPHHCLRIFNSGGIAICPAISLAVTGWGGLVRQQHVETTVTLS
jgi:hypothetical protein